MSDSPTVYDPIPPGKKLIFRRYVTDPVTGKRRDAWLYRIKAWPILVDDDGTS
jgi:hypothetical protein